MSLPLYEAKAELFRLLGHPVRIRVLELLQSGPKPVHELLAEIEVEPTGLSQHLAVLRRSGVVNSQRSGTTMIYRLNGAEVAELLRAARALLAHMLDGQHQLLAELRQTDDAPQQ
ncbi:ArsR/SmtB family transcription factor [Nonomuraea sp. NPDC050556]|uniref:ArsR/SmtB family transcription factor n=1 Tax=Nonomuraea sp. NPDC050556 TaxID=3364369 RepID=UPI0037936F56